MKHFSYKNLICVILSAALTVGTLPVTAGTVQAADKVLTLATARSLALENSSKYEAAEDAVSSKEAARDSAIKGLKIKKKNMSTFRWTPLLSFKFPQKPNFAEESQFQFKPLQLSNDIKIAEHKKQDTVFDVDQTVNNLFVNIVTNQENLKYNEKRLETLVDGIKHNKARLKQGLATQADIDRQEKKQQTLEDTIAANRRSLEADLKKLSETIGMDVTTGYTFEKPYVEAKIDRSSLDALKTYTADRDEAYYEAAMAATTARILLSTNADIMRNYYGGDYNMISGYVNQALNDQKVSSKAFKSDYKRFLTQIDHYWDGNFYLYIPLFLVLVFPKEWLKGDLDGARYIEDDPYTLYQNTLDYISARNDEKAALKELEQSVEDEFNNYISVRNSYESLVKQVDDKEKELKVFATKNRMGLMTLEEYEDEENDYEELQNSMLDAMKLYTDTLYSLDRRTCGGVSALLSGTDADLHTAVVGESYVTSEKKEATYFLNPIIQREMFELSIYIPDDFDVEITDFELWCDNERIGERTPKDKTIRHLALAKDKVDKTMIRLYNGSDFVDDCVIDPGVEKGTLNITTRMDINKDETGDVGTYEIEQSNVTGLINITLTPLESEKIGAYRILDTNGTALGSTEPFDIKKSFTHLGLVSTDLKELKIEFYGEDKALKYTGYFDTENKKLKKDMTEKNGN